ncbi:MAG: DNA repair exonuclease, partial [Elusimicrobia bacterium]|nr:DNA repair exonuclease [Elusimicrobiota bacterium]
MTKIIHAADLHLKETEKDYCFGVLAEIIDLAAKEGAAFLLFCGDLFDSFEDMKALKDAFRLKLERLKGCEVIYLPGNHENLRRAPAESLESYDLGPVTKCLAKPYTLLARNGVEFLAVAHQESYAGYRDWGAPPVAEGKARVLLLHGTDSSVYTGPETEETKSGVIDGDLFEALGADYAALGHIHARSERRAGRCLACYSGSARVWRGGEEGPRGVYLLAA